MYLLNYAYYGIVGYSNAGKMGSSRPLVWGWVCFVQVKCLGFQNVRCIGGQRATTNGCPAFARGGIPPGLGEPHTSHGIPIVWFVT